MTLTRGVPPAARTLTHGARGQWRTLGQSSGSDILGNSTYGNRPRQVQALQRLRERAELRLAVLGVQGAEQVADAIVRKVGR